MGILALVRPCRALLIWAAIWTIWTALLRPLAGESVWEFFERAGNYGVPLALLAIAGSRGALSARLSDRWAEVSGTTLTRLTSALRVTTTTLLVGHAGCGLINKPLLTQLHGGVIAHPSATLVLG